VGGVNYGQGSSREHAALAPMYLGVKAVLAQSFSRIHKANLTNFGIIPLEFANLGDYQTIKLGSRVKIDKIIETLKGEAETMKFKVDNCSIECRLTLTRRLRDILIAGGLLNYTKIKRA
jgi:aconitate hydratase